MGRERVLGSPSDIEHEARYDDSASYAEPIEQGILLTRNGVAIG